MECNQFHSFKTQTVSGGTAPGLGLSRSRQLYARFLGPLVFVFRWIWESILTCGGEGSCWKRRTMWRREICEVARLVDKPDRWTREICGLGR